MKEAKDYFICIVTLLLTTVLCYFIILPNEVEHRVKALGIMSYDNKTDKFVLKSDNVQITQDDFYYIKYGYTKK